MKSGRNYRLTNVVDGFFDIHDGSAEALPLSMLGVGFAGSCDEELLGMGRGRTPTGISIHTVKYIVTQQLEKPKRILLILASLAPPSASLSASHFNIKIK